MTVLPQLKETEFPGLIVWKTDLITLEHFDLSSARPGDLAERVRSFRVRSMPFVIESIGDAITNYLGMEGYSGSELARAEISILEALGNGMEHSHKFDGSRYTAVRWCVRRSPGHLLVTEFDYGGNGFDLGALPAIDDYWSRTSLGQRGLKVIHEQMDVAFFADEGRKFYMAKRLGAPSR